MAPIAAALAVAACGTPRFGGPAAPVTTEGTRVLVLQVRDRAFAVLDPEDRAGEWQNWWLLARDLRVVEWFSF